MSIYSFVEVAGEKYRIKPSPLSPFGFAVVVWDRHNWKQIPREKAAEVLRFVGKLK